MNHNLGLQIGWESNVSYPIQTGWRNFPSRWTATQIEGRKTKRQNQELIQSITLYDLEWSQIALEWSKMIVTTCQLWINSSLKITVPSNSGYDDATERSNLEAMKKQSFSTYTLAPSLAAMDEGMFLWTHTTLFDPNRPHLNPYFQKLRKIRQHHGLHHIMAVFIS